MAAFARMGPATCECIRRSACVTALRLLAVMLELSRLVHAATLRRCHVQTSMALLRPPALKAMFANKGGFFNAHTSGVRNGGELSPPAIERSRGGVSAHRQW